MASKKSSLLVALILVGQSAAFALPDLSHLFRRAPFSVSRYASLGESFASGPSAGDPYDQVTKCRRYKEAQGPQVAADGRIQGPKPIKFDFIACSGSKLKNIWQDSTGGGDTPADKPKIAQAKALKDTNPDLVTMSIGGNDVGFVDLLDRCVYRFYDLSGCRGCGPFPRLTTNDCTDDCNKAVDAIQIKIDGQELAGNLTEAIKEIFRNAPKTKLFITGYPRFWNADTDACDKVSFKFGCLNNSILPLIKARRAQMNQLTNNLNARIKSIIDNYPTGASITYVDPNPFFDGHRFCEEGVSEPSYRNDKIFFYPFEYYTGGTLNIDGKAAGDCQAILDNGGDQGDFFACEMANEINAGNAMDLSKQPNNVNGEVAISSSDNLPDYLARIFHPTKGGMTGYRDAIVSAYSAYNGAAGPTSSGAPSQPTPTPGGTGGGAGGQQIALASYTNPLGDPAAWKRLISYDSSKLSILVANVLNGPDSKADTAWGSVIEKAAGSGKTVIGYVRTGYLGVSVHKFKTRLGSGDLADWASQIEQDVDKWFELYPGIGGIFFDEGWPECGPNNIYSGLYAHINAYTKRKHSGAFTVLNPGSAVAQCFEDTMDTLLTFESSYETYTSAYVDNGWTPKDDRKIWHIVYRVPQDKIESVAALSRSRHVGYLEVTDDDNPNPYDNVPNDAYMNTAMGAVSGGKVLKNAAPTSGGSEVAGVPGDSTVISSDYTSATITWSAVANALGYAVYQNGQLVLEMPSSLTRATVGMLEPGTSASFEVKTILSSGGGGGARSLTASTKSLPSNGSITNVSYKNNGGTVVYTADVLVPYAFVRLFIGGPHKAVGASTGWPITAGLNNDTGGGAPMPQFKLVNYMVEGNDFYSYFYKYSGAYVEAGTADADWTWSQKGTAPQSQSGYTYTWNVPLAGTDAQPEDYVVQGQGYAPLQNVFGGSMRSYKCAGEPCDDNPDYDCKGSTLCTTPDLLKWCDHAANNLTRTNTYGTIGGGVQTGNCWGDGSRGCGVFLQGDLCAMSGEDMWNNYQNIRKLGGCSKCGSWHQTNGCLLTVNYVSNCDIGLETPENPSGN